MIELAKNKDRYFEALDMKKRQRAKLTAKQYLVYSYLVSISKWNANKAEQHYYTYKNVNPIFLLRPTSNNLNKVDN